MFFKLSICKYFLYNVVIYNEIFITNQSSNISTTTHHYNKKNNELVKTINHI